MRGLLAAFESRGVQEQLLLLLVIAICALTFLVLIFALAALLLRARNARTARRWWHLESRWEDAVLDVLGGVREPGAVVALVRPHERLRFVDFLARFARQVRGPERQRLEQAAEPFLDPVARRVTHHDPTVRSRSVQALALLGFSKYATLVLAGLDDPEAVTALAAARALARRDRPEFAQAVLKRLGRFERWDRRFLAAIVAAIGPTAIPTLLATLADRGAGARVRAVAADALCALNAYVAGDAAAQVLTQTTDRDLLCSALRLMARVGRPEHLAAVRACARSRDDAVRTLALAALAALDAPEALTEFAPLLDDPSPWVALEAARALRYVEGGGLLRRLAGSDRPRSELARQVLAEAEA